MERGHKRDTFDDIQYVPRLEKLRPLPTHWSLHKRLGRRSRLASLRRLSRALCNGLHLVNSPNRERTSMTKEIVTTPKAPSSSLYSQAVKAGGLVFVSGQVGQDPSTGTLAGPTVREQTRQCLKNIAAILDSGKLHGKDSERNVHSP